MSVHSANIESDTGLVLAKLDLEMKIQKKKIPEEKLNSKIYKTKEPKSYIKTNYGTYRDNIEYNKIIYITSSRRNKEKRS